MVWVMAKSTVYWAETRRMGNANKSRLLVVSILRKYYKVVNSMEFILKNRLTIQWKINRMKAGQKAGNLLLYHSELRSFTPLKLFQGYNFGWTFFEVCLPQR
jgi:hypothetical protein